ncbi:MAG: class I SAM-dependent methyltransferase [Paracoccaceae bacterium]
MTRDCPICEAALATPVDKYCRDQWQLAACDGCGHVYLRNPPGYGALAEDYAWEKTYEVEHERRLQESPIAYRLDIATRFRNRLFRRSTAAKFAAWFGSGNLLDVGCANSRNPIEGFTHFGIEISKELALQADRNMRPRGGYCIHGPGAKAIWKFEPEQFDGIVMRSYLEHEEEPLSVLKGAARALKRHGAIYARVPNYGSANRKVYGKKWCGFRYPDHVNYFTVSDLRKIAARAGLSVRLLNPIRLPFDDNINALMARTI